MEESIGMRIRQLRQNRSKRQKVIAELLGISVPAYSKIETGATDVNVTRLNQIAAVFGVTPGELLVGELGKNTLEKEFAELKQQYGVLSDYCILLQKRLISAYEEMEEVRGKVLMKEKP